MVKYNLYAAASVEPGIAYEAVTLVQLVARLLEPDVANTDVPAASRISNLTAPEADAPLCSNCTDICCGSTLKGSVGDSQYQPSPASEFAGFASKEAVPTDCCPVSLEIALPVAVNIDIVDDSTLGFVTQFVATSPLATDFKLLAVVERALLNGVYFVYG